MYKDRSVQFSVMPLFLQIQQTVVPSSAATLYKLVSGLFLLYECWCQYLKLRNIFEKTNRYVLYKASIFSVVTRTFIQRVFKLQHHTLDRPVTAKGGNRSQAIPSGSFGRQSDN